MKQQATVKIRQSDSWSTVRINPDPSLEITEHILEKWKTWLDLVTKIATIPSALIMRLDEDTLEVFVRSNTPENPFVEGEKSKLGIGLYCETVIGTQKKLLVPDATNSPIWKENNPDVELNMISYLGYPINWPDGSVFGTLCILDEKENHYTELIHDLMDKLKQIIEQDLALLIDQKKLTENESRLKELNATKDKFFSIIAHDLKSPFNAILGLSDLLLEMAHEQNCSQLVHLTEAINHSSHRTYELLTNLLDWSRIQTGKMEFQPESFVLESLIDQVIGLFHETASQKSISIEYDQTQKTRAFADKTMTEMVLRNLVSNAIKFTPSGGKIVVSVKENPNEQIISIRDNGVGIPTHLMGQLFRIDAGFSTRGTLNEQGTGLGLILCKEFVEKNGGKIWAESDEEKGSTFYFSIPAKP